MPILEDISLPFLMLAVVSGLTLSFAGVAKFRFGYATLGLMLFCSSLSLALEWDGSVQITWLSALQSRRSELYLAVGILASVTVFAHYGRIVGRPWPLASVMIIALGVYMGLLRFVHEGLTSGISSTMFALLTILPAMLLVLGLLDDQTDHRRLLRMLGYSNAVWVAATAVQIVRDPAVLEVGIEDRFVGFLGNPQHAGVYLALMGAITLFLAIYDTRRMRLFWVGIVGINVILLAWTGSRTAAAMFLMGVAAVTYGRLGRAALYLPVGAVAAFGAYKLSVALGVDLGFERLISTENTRAVAWQVLLRNGLANPIVGIGVGEEAAFSENSFLYGFASYGAGALALLVILGVAVMAQMWQLFRWRPYLDSDTRAVVDLVLGLQGMIMAGAIAEGYLIARVGAPPLILLLTTVMGAHLIRMAATQVQSDEVDWDLDSEAMGVEVQSSWT